MKFAKQDRAQLIPALRVLGEPNRLRILCDLGLECRPVTGIIKTTGLGQTNVSFHLRLLREAGFVRAERRGSFVYYCLTDPELLHILRDLKRWLAGLPKADVNRRRRPNKRRVSAAASTKEVA